jgi:hypothetical protein
MAMERSLLLLQHGEDPVPLDYRDLVSSFRFPNHIDEYVADFAASIGERFQATSPPLNTEPRTLLELLNLGASAAENELNDLAHYYLETDEFRRASRGEVRIVTGRKGAGKTALFAQLRDRKRRDRSKLVLDLKPEGFQLLKFRERVLDYLDEGSREHTITAFWEYLLLLEMCHKLLEKDKDAHMRDSRLFEPYRQMAEAYYSDDDVAEGDFSERMLALTQRIADDFDASRQGEQRVQLASGAVTELLHRHDVAHLRDQVATYLEIKNGVWLLFDNLDKGWPAQGITAADVLTLRSLIDAMSKIERAMGKRDIECHGVVFIRNDVFELLLDNTPDRGKVASIALDWTDADLLREVLRKRFIYGAEVDEGMSFEDIWRRIAVPYVQGEESSQYLIERSLMRPRALIELVGYCRSHAVNLRHSRIELSDIEQGEDAYSSAQLENLNFELRDVYPSAGDLLYEFIGANETRSGTTTRATVEARVGENWRELMELLLWYGFLGVVRDDNETSYIYSVKYDMKRLKALAFKRELGDTMFRINPAFWRALEVVR